MISDEAAYKIGKAIKAEIRAGKVKKQTVEMRGINRAIMGILRNVVTDDKQRVYFFKGLDK
jgi:hypothetical protein